MVSWSLFRKVITLWSPRMVITSITLMLWLAARALWPLRTIPTMHGYDNPGRIRIHVFQSCELRTVNHDGSKFRYSAYGPQFYRPLRERCRRTFPRDKELCRL